MSFTDEDMTREANKTHTHTHTHTHAHKKEPLLCKQYKMQSDPTNIDNILLVPQSIIINLYR